MELVKNGRINIWSAVKKQFEVVHPETEVARITDFADGIVQKLALTSAMTAVTALQTDSWFGKLLKMVLNASGVKYNIATNGYVCLGSFFGGLIIQWGNVGMGSDYYCNWVLPLAVTRVFQVFTTDYDTSESNGTSVGDRYVATYKPSFSNGNTIRFATASSNMGGFACIAICR